MHEGLYDYEILWRLDVLGATSIARDDIAVQQDFKNQEARLADTKLG